ncbi:FAD-binding oxidoreductase [Chitinophaga silvatica]|uniref:D-lactate dehydrogenase (cytochrome) n=1 Tax=Chitinophaga silvatica TaxID=2282649 RepID=A0A3E1Y477_9BACT|nr:FAD-binding and (Fe-S)-binding domain-containing protein [Chitinophaga silvatica]RFS19479.1 FAD-binding oxidoreductase [Chitinophaga silvatica]
MNIEEKLQSLLPAERILTKLIDLVSYASDAGFYYLKPKAVVNPVSEEEIRNLFLFSLAHNIPLTFRTAGTSLSGQSITDGILVDLSKNWNSIRIEEQGAYVRVQPGITGGVVNAMLKKYARKIGPDPASINSAMIGGIISNNASGMCCGVSKNAYHTVKYIRFMLPDGKTFTTESQEDYIRFEQECPELAARLIQWRNEILADKLMYDLIRSKYKTKNTVGYAVNAFIDHERPLDIMARLMVGAEGTLGFISEAVFETVPDYPVKVTSLLCFADIQAACSAIEAITETGAETIELMDNASLRSVLHLKGIPELLAQLPPTGAALLIEYQGFTEEEVKQKTEDFYQRQSQIPLAIPAKFTNDPKEQAFLWKIRKGMFPSVGAIRKSGSTVILEDIAVPVLQLGNAILDLQALFSKYGYLEAIIFGHAKDGNIHFVVTQSFDTAAEVQRYDLFIREVVELVVGKYKGALKAEHGTGRNMAPFVETEWGPDIYRIMKSVKEVVDPALMLNPGVIINQDKEAHIRNLKDLPMVEEEVDKCMECGFCEYKCPSRNLTMTPRRRIVARREIARLKHTNEAEYKELLEQYQYEGLSTCAVDGLCAEACPVDINTGSLVKRLRNENHNKFANSIALAVSRNFGATEGIVKVAVSAATGINKVLGRNTLTKVTGAIKKVIPAVPLWSNQISPSSISKTRRQARETNGNQTVIYFPTCISRTMGGSTADKKNMTEVMVSLAMKRDIKLVLPDDINGTCCGQIFSSKGFPTAFEHTANNTISKLWKWSEEGKWPIVIDISSCTYTLKHCRPQLNAENKAKFDALNIIDSIDFISDYVLPGATIKKRMQNIVLHPVCTLQKTGQEDQFLKIAKQLSEEVTVPVNAGCCGMAGDRGFLFPELTKSATLPEATEVKSCNADGYYSSSKTCEMALSEATGKNYESIVYLLDECL